jgi:hypothetical protein
MRNGYRNEFGCDARFEAHLGDESICDCIRSISVIERFADLVAIVDQISGSPANADVMGLLNKVVVVAVGVSGTYRYQRQGHGHGRSAKLLPHAVCSLLSGSTAARKLGAALAPRGAEPALQAP